MDDLNNSSWAKSSWRGFPVAQKIAWPDLQRCKEIEAELSELPALVFAEETRTLMASLAKAARGDAFVLQCGDCAEEFARCSGKRVHNLLRVILQMATVLSYAGGKRVVGIGRIAGQYAKPRSNEFEIVDGAPLPVYRGDMVNSTAPNVVDRTPRPERMLDAYFRSAATLNLVRAFVTGGYASIRNVLEWQTGNVGSVVSDQEYLPLASEIERALRFLDAQGLNTEIIGLSDQRFYASHEALVLEYEEALTRIDTLTGQWYDTSAHFLWLGERTRQPDGAHCEFLSGIGNPLGIKVGPSFDSDDVIRVIEKLNPSNMPGKISIISRFGAGKVQEELPRLIGIITREGRDVVWICDPMHGNTVMSESLRKTRRFEDILLEIHDFFEIHTSLGSIPGGIHLELTGEHVTECVGGRNEILDHQLNQQYETLCDPRLNAEQSLELAFRVADMLISR